MSTDLEVLQPNRHVMVNGEKVVVKPFKYKNLKEVLEIFQKYVVALLTVENDPASLTIVIAREGVNSIEDINRFINISTGLTPDKFEDLDVEEVLAIFSDCLLINWDSIKKSFQTVATKFAQDRAEPKTGALESNA